MRFSTALIVTSLTTTAFSAPVADPSDLKERQLLSAISPSVTQLLGALGLGSIGTPVGGILNAVSGAVKRDVDDVEAQLEGLSDIERRQLLSALSSPTVQLLSNLGLGAFATPVGGVLTAVSNNVKRDADLEAQLDGLNDIERRQLLAALSSPTVQLLSNVGLGPFATPIGGILTAVSNNVKRDVDSMNDVEKRQLLSSLATPVSQLLGALGLSSIGTPVSGVLGALSGFVKRDDVDAANEVERRQLLSALSPPVVQLLNNIGLGSLSPVGGVLTAVSDNVKRDIDAMTDVEKRQVLSALGTNLSSVLSALGLGSLGTPISGLLTSVGGILG